MKGQVPWRVLLQGTLCTGKALYNHPCLEGHLGQFKERLLCILFRSHFASTACNKYLKMELGKKSWQNWHCLYKCKCWAAVVAAATGRTASARAHRSQFLLDLLRHLCDQGTKILPNASVLWYFTLQHASLVSWKSYSNEINMVKKWVILLWLLKSVKSTSLKLSQKSLSLQITSLEAEYMEFVLHVLLYIFSCIYFNHVRTK